MNLKAENFKKFLAEREITYFKVAEGDDLETANADKNLDESNSDAEGTETNDKVTFQTYVSIFGQKLPTVVIIDDSIYTVIRVQVIPDTEYNKNRDEFVRCVNEMNIAYKAVKYYLGNDNALYLDMYVPNRTDDIDGELVISLIDAINSHLQKEYPNWMKLLWN